MHQSIYPINVAPPDAEGHKQTISPILAVNFHPFWRSNSYPSSVPTWGVLREEGEGRREKGDVRREAGIQRDRETGEGDKGTGDMETRDREMWTNRIV